MNTPRKALIIRFSSIGDIVLTTPVIRCLKEQLGTEIHFLTKKSFQPVLAANPYLTKIHTIQKRVGEKLNDLQAEKYDLIIDLHNNLRSHQVSRKLKVATASFNKINLEKWLMVNLKVDRLPNVHIVDRYLETLRPLQVSNDQKGLDYFIPEKDEIAPGPLLGTAKYIAFVIGAAHQTKCLPADKVIRICQHSSLPVALLGGPAEAEEGEAIARAAGPRVHNFCGQFNLNQSASLVRQAKLIITHDTGLMHIAAALNKDIISIWGNTIPAFGMFPYNPGEKFKSYPIQVKNLSCRPCSKIGYRKCPRGHFKCMRQIPEDRIGELIESYSE